MASHDPYYDTLGGTRSPSGQHQPPQSLRRASSRSQFERQQQQYDPYNTLYTAEDHARYVDPYSPSAGMGGYAYGAHTWNPSNAPFEAMTMAGATGRIKAPSKRAALPSMWTAENNGMSVSPGPAVSPLAGMGGYSPSAMQRSDVGSDPGIENDELIPTAIVIKNIPFAVKKEQLVDVMTFNGLPLPYAFNYHFDNGVFRGLAFANFTTADETIMVIDKLNGYELQGRKLRVEYKKMLPLHEREEIERKKRERRGQLEEQHRSMPQQQPPPLASSPTPQSQRNMNAKPDVDLNDPQTLQFYSQLLLFRDDHTREALIFPPTLSPQQRRIVHTLAHHMALAHVSKGTGDNRQVHVFRAAVLNQQASPNVSPPISNAVPPTVYPISEHPKRPRELTRATTMDFTDTKSEGALYRTMGRETAALLDIPSARQQQNLRAAKSFADLRSYTPSPVPSSASFPAALVNNISRYQDYGSVSSATPNLTPTATGSIGEQQLVNGLSGMTLSPLSGGLGGSMRGDPRMLPQVEEERRTSETSTMSPGSNTIHRSYSMSFEGNRGDQSQVQPYRQPSGPGPQGFTRRRRGSGELDVQSGVVLVVE